MAWCCGVAEAQAIEMLSLLKCESVLEVQKYIRTRTLEAKHLIRFSNAVHLGRLPPLRVRNLVITLEGEALSSDLCEISQAGAKAHRRIRKLASKLNSANRQHIMFFAIPEAEAWWTISFDLRDLWEIGDGHWSTPHVHHSSHLFQPILPFAEIEARVLSGDKSVIPHDEHIAFSGYIGQDMRL